MKYRIYIDEVGNPDLESSNNPNHRFLSLTGVILNLEYADKVIHPQMETLKKKYFHYHPDDPIVFHRKEIVNAIEPFNSLIDSKIRTNFNEDLLNLLEKWQYTVISVCLDKKKHKEQYTVWRYDPYHYCLAVLLERFVLFLNRHDSYGDVMAESRGGKEDLRLKASFSRIWENGTDFVNPDLFQRRITSKQLKVKTKANNISGLQLADILAHPSRNEILIENNLRETPLAEFAKKIVQLLQVKYDYRDNSIFGKKFL